MSICPEKLIMAQARECMNDKELCEKSGISKPTLATIKRNGGNPKPATIGRLARALNVSVEYLLDRAGENTCKSDS